MRRVKAYATEQNDACVCLLRFSHAELAADILLTDAGEDVTIGADTYLAVPLRATLPDETEETPPAGRLVLDNVSRTAIAAVRSISTPLACELTVVWASEPLVVEEGPFDFEVRNVGWTAVTMTADLVFEPVLGAAVPADTFNPVTTPGLFT